LASFVANDQLTPILVTTAEPVPGFDAPTPADLDKPALHQLVGWSGIAGPDGLPDDVAATWGEWMAKATAYEDFLEKMMTRGSAWH
jgi:tripartite-type tricarboxylate transporter receptor subunit TctC